MTFNKITDHSNPIFARLEFLKIDDIRQLQLLSFVYDCLNRTAPVYFHDYFVSCSQLHHFNTRLASRGDLFIERKNTFQYDRRSIEYNVQGFGTCFLCLSENLLQVQFFGLN